MSDIDGDGRAATAPYVRSLPLYTMETSMMTWVLNRNCHMMHDLEIAYQCHAISRTVPRSWECAAQSWDCTYS